MKIKFMLCTLILLAVEVSVTAQKMPRLKNPSGQGYIPCGSCAQPANILSETTVAIREPGERISISGIVYQADGKTPASGVVLFFYQTDNTGHYNSENDPNDPRIRGWVKTDAKGRYKFNTIKPAPYPTLTMPAHIHVHRYSNELPENWMDDYWFQGDALLKSSDVKKYASDGDFSPIVRLTKDKNGVLNGTRNMILK